MRWTFFGVSLIELLVWNVFEEVLGCVWVIQEVKIPTVTVQSSKRKRRFKNSKIRRFNEYSLSLKASKLLKFQKLFVDFFKSFSLH